MRSRNITYQIIWTIAFLLALPLALSSADRIKPYVSLFDWNKDVVKDTLIFFDNPSYTEGRFIEAYPHNDLEIHMSNGKSFLLSNITKNGACGIYSLKDTYGDANGKLDDFLGKNRTIIEKYYFLLSLMPRQSSPFLFLQARNTDDYEGPPNLIILSLDSTGCPYLFFEKTSFEISNILDLDKDQVSEIVGFACYGQGYDQYIRSYNPVHVYNYKDRSFKLDTALSKSYNIRYLDGWAGIDCDERLNVVEHPKLKKRKIMNLEDALKLEKKLNRGRKVDDDEE